ncbi:T9SS type A sorting domain-containing protein [Xanthomarina spongicola]|uniref:Putative secreted protein (Por secretion system target) n=1 Tax=Xanthomarina spongicola TaxID=570520 RepID=A0A316DJ25_9FLAO|nr:T9SS type A sorting domain-containing protein [Xanthomarina spongicola]PWK17895.1 putative secreted protein (Por secretion system target) [Xanthomarina spongicola]
MKKNYILFLFMVLFVWVGQAQIVLTQSNDPVGVTDGGVACWSSGSGEYRENSFYRAYNLADFSVTEDFQISSVEYGQGAADDGKVITVNIYTASSDDLTTATLTLIETATHTSSSADDLTLISVPISATIPAGSTIAFEVMAGDSGTNIGETFFPGINAGGENDDSYIKSEGCSINTPSTLSSIGFGDNQYVMNVVGDVLGVEEFSLENSVSIFPNPTSNIITIDTSNKITVNSLELYNIVGKQVIKTNNVSTLDLSELSSGVYMLRVITDSGTLTKKIIRN